MNTDNNEIHGNEKQSPKLVFSINGKEKSFIIWRSITISLLIVNVIFVFWAQIELRDVSHSADFSALGVWAVSLPIAIIDVISLLYYRFIKRPHGIARVISFTALVLVSLPLVYTLIFVILVIVLHFGKFIF